MRTRLTRASLLTGIAAGAGALLVPRLLRPSGRCGSLPDHCDACGTAPGRGEWHKYEANPVLGGALGSCFDVCLLPEAEGYRMWFSWRPTRSIATSTSRDGVRWAQPRIVLRPRPGSGWENEVNRPIVLRRAGRYHMWYTGQSATVSAIGHAVSPDGLRWTRTGERPVLSPHAPWERDAVMCPDVLWDGEAGVYRMWYSAGQTYEPDAIGYATSHNGTQWRRYSMHPIFTADPRFAWESRKVAGCQVIRDGPWHLMFYIGFCSDLQAHIGLARSRDGIGDWQRYPLNPIIGPARDATAWDGDAVYKPFALRTAHGWKLWYNGRRGHVEQIGLATHAGGALW